MPDRPISFEPDPDLISHEPGEPRWVPFVLAACLILGFVLFNFDRLFG